MEMRCETRRVSPLHNVPPHRMHLERTANSNIAGISEVVGPDGRSLAPDKPSAPEPSVIVVEPPIVEKPPPIKPKGPGFSP
jgi:hypothetical protein